VVAPKHKFKAITATFQGIICQTVKCHGGTMLSKTQTTEKQIIMKKAL
jgi:hypothetical protein